MRFLRRSLVGIFLLAVTIGLLSFAGNTVRDAVQTRMNAEPRSFPERERVFAVNVVEVQPQTIAPVLMVFGEVESGRSLQVRSAVGGTIVETAAEMVEGGTVTAGQLLLRIDPATAMTQLERQEVDRQDAQAELRDAQRALELAQEELASAQGQNTLRQQALTRAKDLRERGVGTAASVESAELAVASAEAAVLSRRQALASAEARAELANTRLARAQIGLKDAQRAVDETEVYAVFSGTLANVTVTNGGRLSPNEQIATLLDPTDLEVAFRVSTSQYAQLLDENGVLIDGAVQVGLDLSQQGLNATGQIIRESAAVGEGQTGRLLFARLDSAGGMRPGDFVTVQVRRPEIEGVALVPNSAVNTDNTVLVLDEENRLQLAETVVVHRQGDDVLIRVGDLAGRIIVVERSPLLGAGIRVRPIIPGAENAPPEEPETVALDAERRAKLLAFVEGSRMPAEVKERMKSQLELDEVPVAVIARLESRMGS
ncbi:efflux RND transporter periplasmic adaptor subunit [Cognatiyoonia sp.]|uniref:efflux RND transporter periplasmic adaptor subunit n=1 Tax=Cognatiyoonia sp. TaxID=2211652 RepID=UPI003F6A0ECD